MLDLDVLLIFRLVKSFFDILNGIRTQSEVKGGLDQGRINWTDKIDRDNGVSNTKVFSSEVDAGYRDEVIRNWDDEHQKIPSSLIWF